MTVQARTLDASIAKSIASGIWSVSKHKASSGFRGSVRVRLRSMQVVFAVVGIAYISFLVGSVIYRSSMRYSISEASKANALQFANLEKGKQDGEGPAVYIKDFYRVELKAGKPSWEVRGKDAEYLAKQSMTKINDADITFYRPNGAQVRLNAREARLFLQGSVLERAYLEGDVKVRLDSNITIEANSGVYEKADEQVEGYGNCHIYGMGYDVTGDSLLFKIEEESIAVNRNVHTRFVPHEAKMSKFDDFRKTK